MITILTEDDLSNRVTLNVYHVTYQYFSMRWEDDEPDVDDYGLILAESIEEALEVATKRLHLKRPVCEYSGFSAELIQDSEVVQLNEQLKVQRREYISWVRGKISGTNGNRSWGTKIVDKATKAKRMTHVLELLERW